MVQVKPIDDTSNYVDSNAAPLSKRVNSAFDGLSEGKKRLAQRKLKDSTPIKVAKDRILNNQVDKKLSACYVALSVIGLGVIISGNADTHSCPNVMLFLTIGCIITILGSLVGLMGCRRVLRDIELDFDGIETAGQHMIQVAFHVIWIVMSLLVLPTATVFFTKTEHVCAQEDGGELNGVTPALAYVMAIITAISMYYSVKIVTWYEMIQSLQELCCLWMILGSSVVSVGSIMTMNRAAFMSMTTDGSVASAVLCTTWAVLLIPLSVFGFIAGWQENKLSLGIHVVLLAILFVVALVGLVFLYQDANEIQLALQGDCTNILKYMSQDWYVYFFECSKYLPLSDENDGACPDERQISIAWDQSATIYVDEIGAEICNLGCVDVNCCDKVRSSLFVLETMVTTSGFWFLVVMLMGIVASWDLHCETMGGGAMDNKVLHHRHTGKIAILILTIVCVAVGIIVVSAFSGTYMSMDASSRTESCNFGLDVPIFNDTDDKMISSCQNQVKDGYELDVDCGGPYCPHCITRNPPKTSAPSEALTPTSSPSISPTIISKSEYTVQIGVTGNTPAQNGGGLGLKARFFASNDKLCTIGEVAPTICGGTEHDGTKLTINTLAKTIYYFYVEKKSDTWTNVQNQFHISVDGGVSNFSLPDPSKESTFDLLGYAGNTDSESYRFARVVCLDATLDIPTWFPCPQFFLPKLERRVHACESNSTCRGCSTNPSKERITYYQDLDEDGYGNMNETISTCQPIDGKLQLAKTFVRNGNDCDDSNAQVGDICPENNHTNQGAYSSGWYIDPIVTSEPRSCDDVCETIGLHCSDEEMQTITNASSCLDKIDLAMRKWCATEDVQYTYAGGTYLPKSGGVFQVAARSNQASCACMEGIFEPTFEYLIADASNGVKLNGKQIMRIELGSMAGFTDPGASCTNSSRPNLFTNGQTVDPNTFGSYVVQYHCCENGLEDMATCEKKERVVVVDDTPSNDCSNNAGNNILGSESIVTEDTFVYGGCTIDKSFSVSMNNVFNGFPDPKDEVYFSKAAFFDIGQCSESPTYGADRRVCYCVDSNT